MFKGIMTNTDIFERENNEMFQWKVHFASRLSKEISVDLCSNWITSWGLSAIPESYTKITDCGESNTSGGVSMAFSAKLICSSL